MLIYKILRADEWQSFQTNGRTAGAPIDLADGFIHFSTAAQAAETAAKHFTGVQNLMLVAIDTDALGDALKWEVSRNDDEFPHYYGTLHMPHVTWAKPMPFVGNQHQFPADMT